MSKIKGKEENDIDESHKETVDKYKVKHKL